MSLLHAAGNTCAVGELDLHALPVTQKDILKTVPITKTTNNALTNTTTSFNFTFEASNNYIDLSEAILYLKYNVETADGTDVTAAENAVPVYNVLHSIFSNVQMLINGEKVTGNYEQYPIQSLHHRPPCHGIPRQGEANGSLTEIVNRHSWSYGHSRCLQHGVVPKAGRLGGSWA